MSLIFDALRQSATTTATGTSPAAAQPHGRTSRKRLYWLGAAACVVLGSTLVHVFSSNANPVQAAHPHNPAGAVQAASAAPARQVAPAPLPSTAPPIPALPPLRQAAAVAAATPPLPRSTPSPAAAAAGATGRPPIAAAAAQDVVHVQSQQLNITVSKSTAPAAQTRPAATTTTDSETAITQAIRTLQEAVAQKDDAAVALQLQRLRQLLPADSLTLLRNEAWIAHNQGDLLAAEERYRQILSRVPEDTQAGVNLALLEAARGQTDNAQTRLLRLAAENGESALIIQALAQIRGTQQ